MKPATSSIRGGETRGLAALDAIIANEDYTATFEKPNTAPTAFEPQSTTLLSPHHHFGSLSCRMLYWRAQDIVTAHEKAKKPTSKPPTSLTGQMLFRDMYFGAQAALGWKFAQTFGNETARFVPWHLPSRVDKETGLIMGEYDTDSEKGKEYFLRWRWGRTGFPWIDALMRQLRLEGWIHHLGRHAVACFLTRGGCYVDWERGAEVFEVGSRCFSITILRSVGFADFAARNGSSTTKLRVMLETGNGFPAWPFTHNSIAATHPLPFRQNGTNKARLCGDMCLS